jgi:tripartite ATP-independent transporter DctP family solute receptor
MKKLSSVLLIALVAASMVFAGGASDSGGKKTFNLKYAHVGIAGEIQTDFADGLAVLVKERTNGTVNIQVFPNSQLGGANEMTDGIKSGTIEMGHHSFSTLGKYLDAMAVFDAPYIFRDADHAIKATIPQTSPVLRELNEEMVKVAGVRVLGVNYRGARQLSTTDFPVYTPADLNGKKIRGQVTALSLSMLKGMGAIPTPVEIAELYTALLTGVVQGQENPITNIYTQKFHEVQKYIMLTSHVVAVQPVFINEKVWQSLGPDNQRIISECIEEMVQKTVQWTNEQEAPVRKAMEDFGVKIIDESKGLRNDLFRQSVNAQIAKDFPGWPKYIQEIQKMQ